MEVYGANICRSCRNFKALMASRGFTVDFIDITENIQNLRSFLAIRDASSLYEEVRARGGVGIPLFIKDDGTMTLDMDEALGWIGQPPVKPEEIVEPAAGGGCDANGCR